MSRLQPDLQGPVAVETGAPDVPETGPVIGPVSAGATIEAKTEGQVGHSSSPVSEPSTGSRPGHQAWCTAEAPEGVDRCPVCHSWQPGNAGRLSTGQTSDRVWDEAADRRDERVRQLLVEAGFTDSASAPPSVFLAALTVAGAEVLRDAAFAAATKSSDGKQRRRVLSAWQAAADRLDRALDRYAQRLSGLRATTPASSRDEYRDWTTDALEAAVLAGYERLFGPRDDQAAVERVLAAPALLAAVFDRALGDPDVAADLRQRLGPTPEPEGDPEAELREIDLMFDIDGQEHEL